MYHLKCNSKLHSRVNNQDDLVYHLDFSLKSRCHLVLHLLFSRRALRHVDGNYYPTFL